MQTPDFAPGSFPSAPAAGRGAPSTAQPTVPSLTPAAADVAAGAAERRPLHEEVADRLRDMLTEGRLAPGLRLNERVLCDQLGVSRTPLREAFKVLAAERLIALNPNRGARVARGPQTTRDRPRPVGAPAPFRVGVRPRLQPAPRPC